MKEIQKYEKRYLAFIDILGWTRAIGTHPFNSLHEILEKIQERCDSHSEQYKADLEKHKDKLKINPMYFEVKYTMFSDSIALSMPQGFLSRICGSSAELIREFLANGFLLRGGLVLGEIYHNKQTIFGEAIINAHAIESKQAKFSRILVERSITPELITHDPTSIIKDHLGDYVVDPFPIFGTGFSEENLEQIYNLNRIISSIENNVKNLADIDSLQKWEYMAKLCNDSLLKFGPQTQKWRNHLLNL